MGNTAVKNTSLKIRKIEKKKMWFIINEEYINNILVKDTNLSKFIL